MPLLSIGLPESDRRELYSTVDDRLVDIVAVHGLGEGMIDTWTNPVNKVLWLRDLLPKGLKVARILTFGYGADVSSFYGGHSAGSIQQHAHTLIADLQANRSLENCTKRPIIFVCHGLGGILVKKALAYSSTKTSKYVEHLYAIFLSTYAILFFGTPHYGVEKASHTLLLQADNIVDLSTAAPDMPLVLAVEKDSETLQAITDQFVPLMKQFHIFFFWEEEPSRFGDQMSYIVDEVSAAPMVDNTERSGIHANHKGMVQFADEQSSSYRSVLEALIRYCRDAPAMISARWQEAARFLAHLRTQEASEITGTAFDVHRNNLPFQYARQVSSRTRNKHFQIPQVVSSFYTGREDVLQRVKSAMLAEQDEGSQQQRRFIIYGIGGSGKTQFCSKFAQDNRESFWGIFWIDATSVETAKQSFSKIGKLGGMEATQSAGKHWLSSLEEPWLLILNNADDPSLDIQDLFPDGQRGHVLVSTRNPSFRVHATVGSEEFRGLREREALFLLLRAAAIPAPWDAATESAGQEISKSLGYLALALIHAGALILQKICEVKDYLEFYQQHRKRLNSTKSSRKSEEYDQFTIYATWDLSLNLLELRRTEASTDAIQLLSIVGFFHFEHIRVDIFTRAVANKLKDLETVPAGSFFSWLWYGICARLRPPFVLPDFLKQESSRLNVYRIKTALHELHCFSLITYDSRDESFSLHPVVHTWARDRLEKGTQALWAHMALSVIAESVLLPPNDVEEIDKDFRRDLLPHLDSCLRQDSIKILDYQSHFGGYRFPIAMALRHTWLLVFREQVIKAAKCGYIYAERGRFHEAAELLCQVKDALVASRGTQHESTTRAMLGLSAVYWGLGRLEEAIDLQKGVVDARKKAYGADHPETLCAMDQLGRSFWLNGQYKEALELQTLTTTRMKTIMGSSHLATLAALDNLGVTYGSWRRYEESLALHQQVLQERTRALGENNEETLITKNNLAMALKDLGLLTKAKELMTSVYEQRKQQLGREHPWTLWALCNLAKVHVELEEFDAAEEMLVPGIAAAKRSLDENHLGVLMGEGEYARLLARQGKLQAAERQTLNVLQRMENSRGIDHPDTLYVMSQLGVLYVRMNDIPKAVATYKLATTRVGGKVPLELPLARDIFAQLVTLKGQPASQKPELFSAQEPRALTHMRKHSTF